MTTRRQTDRLTDNRPTVMHVVHALARGGAEVLVRDLVDRRRSDYRFVVFSMTGDGPLTGELESLGATVVQHERRPGFDLGCARAIARAAAALGVDIIHAHQYSPFVYSALARLFGAWRCKVVYTEHGRPYPDRRKWKRVLANRALLGPLTHRITAVSRFIGEALSRCEALPARRVELIHNGIDPSPHADGGQGPSRAAVRRSLGVADSDLVVLQVAGFRPIKDHGTALRAFAELLTHRPEARLLLAGDGATRPAMQTLADALGLGDRVRLLGERTDVADLWRAADIGLLSSLSEGTSVAVLEAMAAARPVVATAVGGNTEVIVHGATGRLTPRGDAPAMAASLRELADDESTRRRFGRAGRRRVLEHFTQQRMHDRFDALYRELASTPQRAADHAGHLIVFADDYGRHPSSMQHLADHLAGRYRITWINTIGMRRPRLTAADARRAMAKVARWVVGRQPGAAGANDRGVDVVNPLMWPSFAGRWQRAINRRLLGRAVRRAAGRTDLPTTVVTTLPITADLADTPGVDRWVYYMVDDFAAWPGNDAQALAAMDRKQLTWVDQVIGASSTLVDAAARAGRSAVRLTHGVDLQRWRQAPRPSATADRIRQLPGVRAVYWGLVDDRLDREAVMELTRGGRVSVALIGPTAGDRAQLTRTPGVHAFDAVGLDELPAIAAAADVLIMPYRTMPATLAMQPLKLTEYLATDRPVVCLDLPALREWADACDVVGREAFADRVVRRGARALPPAQAIARRRIEREDWSAKAQQFARIVDGCRREHRAAA